MNFFNGCDRCDGNNFNNGCHGGCGCDPCSLLTWIVVLQLLCGCGNNNNGCCMDSCTLILLLLLTGCCGGCNCR